MAQQTVTINLERGTTGLGFNIKGGCDTQVFPGDDSIYVAKIKADGAAAKDQRLQEGDKIIEVNGFSLEHVTHQTAVSKFVGAGDVVKITVLPGEEKRKASEVKSRQISSTSSWTRTVVTGSAVVIIAAAAATVLFVYQRSQRT